MERIRRAASMARGGNYVGMMNELGLQMSRAINITDDTGDFQLDVSIAGVHLKNAHLETTIPILSLTADDFWQWSQISDVVAAINATGHFTAALTGDDGPALTLARQSNTLAGRGRVDQRKDGSVSQGQAGRRQRVVQQSGSGVYVRAGWQNTTVRSAARPSSLNLCVTCDARAVF
ncbi:MAG TPA: hypothetical protein VFA04_18280 [Bryobacteraceae bacterium]|nr:hypothetical protein [Bryobacteraceae bacterium]